MFEELLREKLVGIVELTTKQMQLLEAHYDVMARWNRVLNLTTISSLEEVVERHYGESLFLAAHLPQQPLQIADVGSGAGFPGIPVAIVRPDCFVTLIESNKRKAVFLKEATRELKNVAVDARRAEDVPGRFNHAICRAVSYSDLRAVLQKLGEAADLLTGVAEPPAHLGFDWETPIALPWRRNTYLRRGVSRGTST